MADVQVDSPRNTAMSDSLTPSTICQHDQVTGEAKLGPESTHNLELITAHVERHVGPVARVIHETASQFVHVDILHVLPSAKRDFHVLVTSGLSDRPMNAPQTSEECRYAELYLCLPPSWPLAMQNFSNERNYWPIRLLQMLGRFPQVFSAWLWIYHTVPNFDPPQAYAKSTRLCGAMLGPVISLPRDFAKIELPGSRSIHFFSVLPLHQEEMDFKIKNSGESLMAHLFKQGIADIVDPARKSAIGKKRFGLF
jgi:suppressor of fused protein SUFU